MQEFTAKVIREFNDRGLIWLLESPENFAQFLQLFAPNLAERFDLSRATLVKRHKIDENLNLGIADVLYRVPFQSREREVFVFILNELQTRPDTQMAWRIYEELYAIWKEEERQWKELPSPRPPLKFHLIVPVVFYVGNETWNEPILLEKLLIVPEGLEDFVPHWKTLFIPLMNVPVDTLKQAGNGVGFAMLLQQAAAEPAEKFSVILDEVLQGIVKLSVEAQRDWHTALRYALLLIHHKRSPEESAKFNHRITQVVELQHRQEVQNDMYTMADSLRDEGRDKGRIEGLVAGQRSTLLHFIAEKFGNVPENVREAIQLADGKTLDKLVPRILKAQTASEIRIE